MTGALKKSSTFIETHDGSNLAEDFKRLSLRYAEIGNQEGANMIAFHSADLPLFHAAPAEVQKSVTDFLKTVVSIHEETLASGEAAINSKQLIWRALSRFSLVPHSDFFNHLEDDDVVLVYNDQQMMMFWSLQFFEFASFTVEQIFCGRWWEFTKRDPAIQQQLFQLASDVCTGKLKGLFEVNVPGHIVEELQTDESIKNWVEFPCACSLTKNGSVAGFLVIQRMKPWGR